MTHSYHIFMFPFQWKISGMENEILSKQIDFDNIRFAVDANWERVISPTDEKEKQDLYNEKNYYYKFVHDALYDNGKQHNNLVRHFERVETKHSKVKYCIECTEKTYELNVDAININLYSTGVGLLSFYLKNDNYPELEDVLKINQYGRRVYPPFYYAIKSRSEIAKSISIIGLNGREKGYFENFDGYDVTQDNYPSEVITGMIREVATNICVEPVIDDRMYVVSWHRNDDWVKELCDDKGEKYLDDDDWYRYVFVDNQWPTCQNDDMMHKLLERATYKRWQKYHSLYGVSRYSLVLATNADDSGQYLYDYFVTEYARMTELILVQKASVLRFSSEVTNISELSSDKHLVKKVDSLYKEYIRFVNQIHFREVTAQDQGIEMYNMLYETMGLKEQVEKLDGEIEELYNYVSLTQDRRVNSTMSLLTWIATIAVPITVVASIFGMNAIAFNGDDNGNLTAWYNHWGWQFFILVMLTVVVIASTVLIRNKKRK